MYDIDHYTMLEVGMNGKILMENAGRAISEKVKGITKKADEIAILVGPGNNGGDGFVIGRTLLEEDYRVKVIQVVPDEKIKGDAAYHKDIYIQCGGDVSCAHSEGEMKNLLNESDIIIDAILGIGVHGRLREPISNWVNVVNHSNCCVISVDIPTGLPADEGIHDFIAVEADYTFIVGAVKESAFLNRTAPYYGNWEVVSIGFPKKALEKFSNRKVWSPEDFKKTMPKRDTFSHKGTHGRGLIIGGSAGMPGAIAMSVKAALRTGAGLITAGTVKSVFSTIAAYCLESMYTRLPDIDGFLVQDPSLELDKFDAIAIGMGMGRKDETKDLVVQVLEEADSPVIIDADGLYHLKSSLSILKKRQAQTILTPHPGEMAMLLDISISELSQSPFTYAARFAKECGAYVVLKGKYTIITTPDGIQGVNCTGNQGLAKGGSGDVLTGITLGMVMQHKHVFHALCNACYLHGKAADLQVEDGHSYYDLMATDVIEGISKVYRTIS